ncbi:MAG: hypothetical protein NXH85_05105 [Pseudomonadaceae bacterium]|nr:hypothetical protein [Pseudomonadaceae bacterium]
MKSRTAARYWFVAMLALFAAPALALKPIDNIDDAPVPDGLTLSQVQKAIMLGGSERGWIIKPAGSGELEGTLIVRSHVVKVTIPYSQSGYSILYKDSTNMKYKNGKIHRNYNTWVLNLNGDIQRALLMASI